MEYQKFSRQFMYLFTLVILISFVLPHIATAATFSGPNTITTSYIDTRFVYAVDLDEDGDTDVLSAATNGDTFAWYENNGSESFTEHIITSSVLNARQIFPIDVDGDGDIDLVTVASFFDTVDWYENDGSENFTVHNISQFADGATSVYAIDIDDDDDVDVLSASYNDDKIALYTNDGSENFVASNITTSAINAQSVFAEDVDGDGDIDVLSASADDDKISWYENNGSESFTERIITTSADVAVFVYAVDLDEDGDIDVLSASALDDTFAWYENDGLENFTKNIIDNTADQARQIRPVDIDNDGDIDLVTTARDDNTVSFYENDGLENFTENNIATNLTSVYSVFPADIDSDGDIDVLTMAPSGGNIYWYEQTDTTDPTANTLFPTDNSTDVATDSNLIITFDEDVDVETGNITIYKSSDDSVFEEIVATSSQVTGSGTDTITIDPSSDLDEETEYHVQIDATAFDDTAGNSYAGISDTTTWSFTTADETNPALNAGDLIPAIGAADVAVDTDITLVFNEPVSTETGNVYIYKYIGGNLADSGSYELAATYDVTTSASGDGTDTIVITTNVDLENGTVHVPIIDATAFDDLSGNSFPGTAGDFVSWNFTTVESPAEPESDDSSSRQGTSIRRRIHNLESLDKQEKADELRERYNLDQSTASGNNGNLNQLIFIINLLIESGVIPEDKADMARSLAGGSSDYDFTLNLQPGSVNEEVRQLQIYLNNNGYTLAQSGPGSPGNETNIFGPITQDALIRFQQDNNIIPALGYFGPITREVVNQ